MAHGVTTRRYTSVILKDGAGSPLSRTAGPGPGDFKFSTVENGNYAAIKVLDRGQFYELVPGDDNEIKISGSIYVDGDQTGSSVMDAVLKTGDWVAATTTDPGGVVWAFTLVITESYNGVTNIYTCSKCRGIASWAEADSGNKLDFDITCYGGVVRT
jgi:hypothetical protein